MPSCDYRLADLHALVADVTSYARHPAKASHSTRTPEDARQWQHLLKQVALQMRGISGA
jgi:hypothetical protein